MSNLKCLSFSFEPRAEGPSVNETHAFLSHYLGAHGQKIPV